MPLNHLPNIVSPDSFYEELIHAQRDMTDDAADMFMAKLVLILANHLGDRSVLTEAITLARDNTVGNPPVTAA